MEAARRRIEPTSVAAAVIGFMPIIGVLGVPLGALALRRIGRSDGTRLGKAGAWFGIAYGAMWLLFVLVQRR
jgi:hypothetical protein